MPSDIDNILSVREPAQRNTAPTSMSLYKPSTIYDKKSFELSVTTRSTSLPFPDTAMFKLPDDNDKLAFTIPFNSIYRRLLDNDLYNERLLCVVNGGDPYYGANLINNLCAVLSSSLDTYVYCPQVKSQQVQIVRQSEAIIEEAMKNKLGYNYAYHQRMIAYGKIKTPGDYITPDMYDEYLNFLKSKLGGSVIQAETYIRYVPSNIHCVSFHDGRYYFGTNHGVFMSENPFLDNTDLCSQASVVWPYGYNDGEKFVDYDTYDALHAGLFNHTAVEGMTNRTMLGANVYGIVVGDPTIDLEDALPQFDVFAFMPAPFNLSSEKINGRQPLGWRYDIYVVNPENEEAEDPIRNFNNLSDAVAFCEGQTYKTHVYYTADYAVSSDCGKDRWGPDGYEYGALVWSSFEDLTISRPLSSIEAVAGTGAGMWALINVTPPGRSFTHGSRLWAGWEEDQISAVALSYEWVSINGNCRSPGGEMINLNELRITSVVRSEDDPTVFYLGTTKGLFTCTFKGVYMEKDEYGDNKLYIGADFKYVYGYYDASISSLIHVRPDGYDGSILAGTDYGVLQAANSWYPRVNKTYGDWLPDINFDLSVVTGIGTTSTGVPKLIALSSQAPAMYAVSDAGLNKIYDGDVHGIYRGVLDNAWVAVAWKNNNVEVLKIPESNNIPVLGGGNVINTDVRNCAGIRRCAVSPTGSIYFTVSGGGKEDKLYQLARRWETAENSLRLTTYTAKAGEKVIGFAFAENDKLSGVYPQDTVFVATVSSVYAFTVAADVVIDFFTPVSNMPGGSGLSVVAHAAFPEYYLDVMFYQNESGLSAGKASGFDTASGITTVYTTQPGAPLDNTITSLLIPNYGRVLVTRGGVYKVGLSEENELWFGKSNTDPSPVIEGVFTGAILLDDTDDETTNVKLLMLTGPGTLYIYKFDPGRSELIYQDQLTGLDNSASRIIPSPFNDMYSLSALVVKDSRLNSVTAAKIIDASDFDPSAAVYEFSDITVNS